MDAIGSHHCSIAVLSSKVETWRKARGEEVGVEEKRFSCGRNETLEGIVSTWDGGERYRTLSSETPSPLSLSEMSFSCWCLLERFFFLLEEYGNTWSSV